MDPETILQNLVDTSKEVSVLRKNPDITEFRSVLDIPEEDRATNLTCSILTVSGGILSPPYVFDDQKGTLVAFYHLGLGLSGHRGVLHGGIIMTLLDECMGRASFALLPNKIAVTADMHFSFKSVVKLPGCVVVRTKADSVEGRKVWMTGQIEDQATGTILVVSRALFIEPKGAADMMRMTRVADLSISHLDEIRLRERSRQVHASQAANQ